MEAGKIALTLAVGACGGMLLGKRHVSGHFPYDVSKGEFTWISNRIWSCFGS